MKLQLKNEVTRVPAAPAAEAKAHYASRFAFETDCADVHAALEAQAEDLVVVDVRSEEVYRRGHLPGAINIPHWRLTQRRLEAFPRDLTFVVYCAGPHCNGSTKGALRLAELGRPVKEMIGGVEGWKDEGFALEVS